MDVRKNAGTILTTISLGVVIGGLVGFILPYVLVRYYRYGMTGTGSADELKTLFGFLLYSVPAGGILGGLAAKRWNKKRGLYRSENNGL